MPFPNYEGIPEHMRSGAKLYIDRGLPPGSFLRAVLENDLTGAAGRADDINVARLLDWVMWLHSDIPGEAWGSPEKVNAWIVRGGMADDRKGINA